MSVLHAKILHFRAKTAVLALAFSGLDVRGARAEDEVVVRGHGAGGYVSRATIDDSAREVTDAASLIAPMPGVHVRRLGADDSFATLSIRGTSSTAVAVYLAGVPLTGGADPTLDLATLPLWPGAGARVYRSFAPAALGRGSLGGVLTIDPPSPRIAKRTDVWAAVGSFGSRRIRLGDVTPVHGCCGSAEGGTQDVSGDDGIRIATGFSASRSDDDFSYLDPLATLQTGHDVFADRANAGHAAASGLASIAIPAGRGALTVTTLAQARKQEIPGTVIAPTPFQRLDSSRLLLASDLTQPLGPGTFGVRAWARRESLAIHDARESGLVTLGPTSTDDAIVAAGGSMGWKRTGTTAFELRVDGSGERYVPGTWIGASTPPESSRSSLGFALDGEHILTPVTITGSARADLWSDDGNDLAFRPTAHAGVRTNGALSFAAHGGVLARPASFVERFGDHGVFIGTPDLKPESATTIDGGVTYEGQLGEAKVHLEGVAFATWASDLIVFVARGAYGRSQAANIGSAKIQGVELEARGKWRGFELRASYTGLHTSDDSLPGSPALPGRPDHDLVGDLSYERGPARLRYGVDVVAGQSADLSGSLRVPNRALQSTGLRLAVPETPLTISFDIRNLFDVRAVNYAGVAGPVRAPIGDLFEYPLPGRSFLATARFLSK